MAKDYSRTERVADFIKQELARLIQLELRDPRVGMVSVTGAEVSRDLSHARVFVTVLGKDDAEQAQPSIDALNRAAGFLRTQIAKINKARTTPKLRFFYDESVGRGAYLTELIEKAVADDRAHAAERDDSDSQAGDADASPEQH